MASKLADEFAAWADSNPRWAALVMLVVLFVADRVARRAAKKED